MWRTDVWVGRRFAAGCRGPATPRRSAGRCSGYLTAEYNKRRELCERLREEIDSHGFDSEIDDFAQTYGSTEVDASLLQLLHTGYLAYDDPRRLGTIDRIEREVRDEHGLLIRYRTNSGLDGLDGDERPFLIRAADAIAAAH